MRLGLRQTKTNVNETKIHKLIFPPARAKNEQGTTDRNVAQIRVQVSSHFSTYHVGQPSQPQ